MRCRYFRSHDRSAFVTCILYLFLVILILDVTTGAQSAQDWVGVTIVRKLVVSAAQLEGGQIPLVRLYAEPDAQTPVIDGRWEMQQSGWFPVWNVVIRTYTADGLSELANEQQFVLGPIRPALGHEYEVALSYLYGEDILAFALIDRTSGETVTSGDWRLETAVDGKALHAAAGEYDALFPVYVPVSIRWDIVEGEPDKLIPVRHIVAGAPIWLRLITTAPLPDTLSLVARSGSDEIELPLDVKADKVYVPLEVSQFPAGPVFVTLRYTVGSTPIWESTAKRVIVGRVSATLDTAHFNRARNSVDLYVSLRSDRPLEGLDLRWVTTVSKRSFDDASLSLVDTPYAVHEVRLDEVETQESRTVLYVPLPNEPGLWRLELRLETTPEIATLVNPKVLTVSTTTGHVLGLENADTETIRVCTYNMLNFEGWPQEEAQKDLGAATDPRRLDHFTRVIRDLDCDILGIQEGYSVDAMRTIAHRLGLNVVPFPSATRFPGGTLTRFPVLESRTFNQAGLSSQNLPFSRFAGASLLDIEGRLVWVVNLHAWPHDENMRTREASILGQQLDQLASLSPYIIVLGDFNSGIGAAIDTTLRQHGLVNAMYLDWITGIKPAIDHIYVTQEMAEWVVRGWVESGPGFVLSSDHQDRKWANSDHRPTIVELVWPPTTQ